MPGGMGQSSSRLKTTFISCTRCRERKIKCSGERPSCVNCLKKSYQCHYDAVVKRRGPDKEPGGRLKPRGSFVHHVPHGNATAAVAHGSGHAQPALTNGVNAQEPRRRNATDTRNSELVKATRAKWWDTLFAGTPRDRVIELCKDFLTDCHIWFNFFHRALFFKSFFTQEFGAHVVFAIMAHMTFLREGTTTTGQLRALHFAEEARKMVNYCLAANDRDPTLAQTALLLVAFEFQPHMQQNLARATAAFGFMETCARTCLPYWAQAATDRGPTSANSPAAIRREEMRQMCWALSHLAANSAIWRHLVGQPPLCLSSADPVKFVEIFPPFLFDADRKVPKLYAWSLYCSAMRLWHGSVNRVPGPHSPGCVCEQARDLLPLLDSAPYAGSRRYLWQAREWVTAARGYLGDLDEVSVQSWFRQQKETLIRFVPSNASEDAKETRPTYSWWYLMVAYTSLQLSAQYPSFAKEAQDVLAQVLASLDDTVAAWPCSNLERLCEAVRKHNNNLNVRI